MLEVYCFHLILKRSQTKYIYSSKTLDLHIQGETHLPNSLKFPIETHKKAHKAIRIGKKRNETPFLPALFIVAVSLLPAAMLLSVGLIFTLLKLDIRFKARFTKGFSAADAGVVGIESTKAHRAEDNLLVLTSSTVLL